MKPTPIISIVMILLLVSVSYAQPYEATGKIVGVDNQGKGIVGNVSVEIQSGKGRVLVDTYPLTGIYTQDSERIAVQVTSEVTGFDFSAYDVIYTIRTPGANVVEGPSAGSVMTLATIAAVEGKTLSDSLSMTGTIQEDHTIGKVGQVLTKAKAAADSGVTVFLIPEGQAIQYEYVRKTKTPAPGWVVETIEPVEVNVKELAKEWGMKVHEVATIEEAVQYAFGEIPEGKAKKTTQTTSLVIPRFSSPVPIYNEFGDLTSRKVDGAQSTYQEAREKLDKAVLPDDVKAALDLLLTRAQLLDDEANTIETRGYIYSSGNNAFRSIIDSETVIDLVDYYSLPQVARRGFIEDRLDEVKKEILETKPAIKSQTENAICDANKFEWAVAARQRITYAENRVDSILLPEDGDVNITSPADILFDINVAEEWIKISEGFASKAVSNVESGCVANFKARASEILTRARISVIAAETAGARSVTDGKWFLDAAEKEFSQGWYITAIYDATAARVRSEAGVEYENQSLSDINDDFNAFSFTTSDLIGTIFLEHAQYTMYTAVKDDDQRQAVEAISLLNLAREIDAANNEIKSQLTPGEETFRISEQGFLGIVTVLLLIALFYIFKLRSDVEEIKRTIRLRRNRIARKRRRR